MDPTERIKEDIRVIRAEIIRLIQKRDNLELELGELEENFERTAPPPLNLSALSIVESTFGPAYDFGTSVNS